MRARNNTAHKDGRNSYFGLVRVHMKEELVPELLLARRCAAAGLGVPMQAEGSWKLALPLGVLKHG